MQNAREAVPQTEASYHSVAATRSPTNLRSVAVAENLTHFCKGKLVVAFVADQHVMRQSNTLCAGLTRCGSVKHVVGGSSLTLWVGLPTGPRSAEPFRVVRP